MTTFAEKLRELIDTAHDLPSGAIEDEASAFLRQAAGWPVTTQVPLSRVVYVMAAMMLEANPHERRMTATDIMELRSSLG